jgi:hypothetical protein
LRFYIYDEILNEYGGAYRRWDDFRRNQNIIIWPFTFYQKHRDKIRYWLFAFVMFFYCCLILQNAISEYFFWNEFGNEIQLYRLIIWFILAEVIGNIMESYPVVPLFSGLFIIWVPLLILF